MSSDKGELTPGWRPMAVSLVPQGADLVILFVDAEIEPGWAWVEPQLQDVYVGPTLNLLIAGDWCLGLKLGGEAWRIDLYRIKGGGEACYVYFPVHREAGHGRTLTLGMRVPDQPFRFPQVNRDTVSGSDHASGVEILWPDERRPPASEITALFRALKRRRRR